MNDLSILKYNYPTIINQQFPHKSLLCSSQGRPAEPVGPLVDSLVHRFVRRPGSVFPHRQLLRVVLPTGRKTPRNAVHAAHRSDKFTGSRGDPAAALSPVRAAALRLRQLRRHRGQNVRREARHLRDLGAGSTTCDAGAGVEDEYFASTRRGSSDTKQRDAKHRLTADK